MRSVNWPNRYLKSYGTTIHVLKMLARHHTIVTANVAASPMSRVDLPQATSVIKMLQQTMARHHWLEAMRRMNLPNDVNTFNVLGPTWVGVEPKDAHLVALEIGVEGVYQKPIGPLLTETDKILLLSNSKQSAGISKTRDGASMARNANSFILLNLPQVQEVAAAGLVMEVAAGIEGGAEEDVVVVVEADEVVILLFLKVATTMAPHDEKV
mmetsp:Transcript_31470/g.76198  ORF Transcript_31470/g.76198 Transcript_31470/m.76198 type:complete len:211 (-) Transcript_31470:177-809(-)